MARAASRNGDGPIIIKKYANRRLYNTHTSKYITLDFLAELTRKDIDFKVVDAKSNEDITHGVLTQIIMDEENNVIIEAEIDNNITSANTAKAKEIDTLVSSLEESKIIKINEKVNIEVIDINVTDEINIPKTISPITTITNKEENQTSDGTNFIGALEGFIVLIFICMIASGLSRIFNRN